MERIILERKLLYSHSRRCASFGSEKIYRTTRQLNLNRAFKYRIYPTEDQKTLLGKTFGCVRSVYNAILGDKKKAYAETGKNITFTPAGYKEAKPWLKEVDSLALSNSQLHIEAAFKNFFEKRAEFPKFKAKYCSSDSCTTNLVNGNIRFEGGKIRLPKLGLVTVIRHREAPDYWRLKSVTVSLEPSGDYYVSVLYELDFIIPATGTGALDPNRTLGVDFSMPELYVDSNGDKPGNPKNYRKSQKALAKAQKALSRSKKKNTRGNPAKNRNKKRLKVAKIHRKIRNQRRDFLHKLARLIVSLYDVVCIEDLNMRGMSQSLNFGKSVMDNGWGMFIAILTAKMTAAGKQVIKIFKSFPSSKKCSSCGNGKLELGLGERVYHCEKCGATLDRDVNAALNIRREGMRLIFENRGAPGDSL
jgi:putative transposase